MRFEVEREDTPEKKVNLNKEKTLARNNYSYEKRQKELAKKKKKEEKKQRKNEEKNIVPTEKDENE